MFVDGDNFTDRVKETRRLIMDFESGLNVILISPRRMGKTSLVKHVQSKVDEAKVKVVYMDIYDCRSEYDFYNRFAAALMKQTASRADMVLQNIKDFLFRISPKITFSPDPLTDFSLSLGITSKDYAPEEILSLPEMIYQRIGKHIVVCIDEFQQVGEFPDSLTVQKRMRGVWQLQKNVSYCLFGSKKHLLTELFQSKRMPFYQFGDTIYLEPIPTEDWVPFIVRRFEQKDMFISAQQAARICELVHNHSSYVQQLAWNVMLNTEHEVTDQTIQLAMNDLITHNTALFMQQIDGLTTYQMNFLRAVAGGVHDDFTSQAVLKTHNLGTKSNITRLISVLTNKELIERHPDGIFISDPVLEIWLQRRN